jgi:TonB family protein
MTAVSTILLAMLVGASVPDLATSPEPTAQPEQTGGASATTGKTHIVHGLVLPANVKTPAIIRGDINWWYPEDRPLDVSPDAHGRVDFTFEITIDGRLTNCAIVQSSGYPSLDSTTCTMAMKRARFKPAINADGNPMLSYGRRAANW